MGDRLPRKLAAILYADVADYSRLTGEDEDATHHVLRAHLNFISSAIQNHSGRVVHYAGDAVLADFNTVLDALQCATAIQAELKERNAKVSDERKLQFRIGVNLGDVIVDQHEIYGDGVNVAARLESIAEPGGICISEAVRTAVGNKLPLEFDDLGEQRVKNIQRSVHVYRSRLKPGEALPASTGHPKPLSSPESPRRIRKVTALAAVIALSGIIAVLMWMPSQEQGEQIRSDVSNESQTVDETLVSVEQEEQASSDEKAVLQTVNETLVSVKPEKQQGVVNKENTKPLDESRSPVQREREAAAGKFLSEDEIRRALIGNTISFNSPRNGQDMLVYFADNGGVTVKAEHNPDLVKIHNWYFKDGNIFCRTVLVDRRNHCTRVVVGDDINTLNFINAKKGVFYKATVFKGRQLPE